jgi:hypothetical protein
MRQDLQRVRTAWDDCQSTRDRNAIYGYLTAVYGLVAWWRAEARDLDRARRALCLKRLEVSDREDSDLLISDGCDWSGVIAKLFAKSMRPARKAG